MTAGTPATAQCGGTSFKTTLPAAIIAPCPISMLPNNLAPVAAFMKERGVRAKCVVDIAQIEHGVDPARHLDDQLSCFFTKNWPFGEPIPQLYYDKRALEPGPSFCSLHAKCVVVDGMRAFVSSANFTERGRERNIEVGVLIEDALIAGSLLRQWIGLIDGGFAGEFVPKAPPMRSVQ